MIIVIKMWRVKPAREAKPAESIFDRAIKSENAFRGQVETNESRKFAEFRLKWLFLVPLRIVAGIFQIQFLSLTDDQTHVQSVKLTILCATYQNLIL